MESSWRAIGELTLRDANTRLHEVAMSKGGISRIAKSIRAWASETGLEWWVDLVTSEFRYLERYGFRVEETHLHFLGNYIRYRNPLYDLVISYEPESTATLEATLQRRTEGEPSPVLLDALLHQHAPEVVAPPRSPLVRSSVQATIRFWATGLQGIADEVFGAEGPRFALSARRRPRDQAQ